MRYGNYLKAITLETIRDFSAFGNPIVLLILTFLLFSFPRESISVVIGLMVVELLSVGVKLFYFKERPTKQAHSNLPEKIYAASFPSSHASRSSFFFLALYSVSVFPFNLFVLFLFFMVGISRITLKKHFIIDVLVGYGIGLLVFLGWIISL